MPSAVTSITQGTNVVPFGYDAANRRRSLTLPNGIVTVYGYGMASQLTSLTYTLGATTLGDVTCTYDGGGQCTSVGGSWARTNLPAALTSATYDAANQIATFGGISFTYDPNGNLTADGTSTFMWNARNQLTSISGGVSASFVYDGANQRRAKTVAGTTTAFLYDGLNLVQEQAVCTTDVLARLDIHEYFANQRFRRSNCRSSRAVRGRSRSSAGRSRRTNTSPFGRCCRSPARRRRACKGSRRIS